MPEDDYYERPLFGGAISSCFPLRFQDLSEVREVPDHQEAFADSSHDESLIFELLDFKSEVEDNTSAVWFLQDIAREQDAEGSVVHEHSGNIEAAGLQNRNVPVVCTTAVGQMAISKARQLREAQNVVRVYLANLRLKEAGTDVLITAYEPILIKSGISINSIFSAFTIPQNTLMGKFSGRKLKPDIEKIVFWLTCKQSTFVGQKEMQKTFRCEVISNLFLTNM